MFVFVWPAAGIRTCDVSDRSMGHGDEGGIAPSKGSQAWMGILMSLNDTPGLQADRDQWKK